ncbi:substrate-binding periplasmic protein [Streptomyces specialis]|uniref:substrate-binding periplasmic protein n=1 Tax=Streptomyces specialis TaxID=498367 RepID=UPI00073F86D5|nr:transporter substrate-binding domain-containing protein [Streptomyces specialis]
MHAGTAHDPVIFAPEGDDELTGFEVDLVEAIGERLGVAVTFDQAATTTAAAEAAVLESDDTAWHIAVGNFVDNEDQRDALGVDFVNHFVDGWAVVSEDPKRSGDLDDLCGLSVILYANSPTEDAVREDVEDCTQRAEILPATTKDEMAEAIREGEADVAVLVYTQAAYYVAENPEAGLSVSFSEDERGSRGIAVPGGQIELREAVFEAMSALISDGTYGELLRRWHIENAALTAPDVNRGS